MKLIVNGKEMQIEGESICVEDLLRLWGATGPAVAVEVNKEVVRRENLSMTFLKDGDCVEIVGLVGGG